MLGLDFLATIGPDHNTDDMLCSDNIPSANHKLFATLVDNNRDSSTSTIAKSRSKIEGGKMTHNKHEKDSDYVSAH